MPASVLSKGNKVKILYYAITVLCVLLQCQLGDQSRVLLAESEIIVFDTSTVEMIPTPSTSDRVARSVFTTQVTEHEPMDRFENLQFNNSNIIYFTELRNMSGQTSFYRWHFNGNVMTEDGLDSVYRRVKI